MTRRSEINPSTDPMSWVDGVLRPGPGAVLANSAKARLRAALRAQAPPVYYDVLPDSLLGAVYMAAGGRGLLAVGLATDEDRFVRRIAKEHGTWPVRSPRHLQSARRQVEAYLSGKRKGFDVVLDLSGTTPFQRTVLDAARRIPHGAVLTYGGLAQRLHRSHAGRAVGQALAHNPLPLVIPCHRVVSHDGGLRGYLGDRIGLKARLLALEGVRVQGNRCLVQRPSAVER